MEQFYTTEQVAMFLLVHPFTVFKFIKDGKLKGFKIGRMYRIMESDMKNFLEERMTTPSKNKKESEKKKEEPPKKVPPDNSDPVTQNVITETKTEIFSIDRDNLDSQKPHSSSKSDTYYII